MSGKTCRAWAVALEGLGGNLVEVETHVADGLPKFVLIGLPDASLGEAEDRVRAALHSVGCALPPKRVTTNMSPASLRKHGSGFDLAIAVSILAATGVIHASGPARNVHIGELALNGVVRSIPGVLPAVLTARNAGADTVIVPRVSQAEAELVEGIRVVPIGTLHELAVHYGAEAEGLADLPSVAEPQHRSGTRRQDGRSDGEQRTAPDLHDVIGQEDAVRALLVAAAGGHNLYMLGPPGSGKTMLAERLPGILPDLDVDAAIEAAALRSLRGIPLAPTLDVRPPFQAPHHTASTVSIIGGGSGVIQPGALSLAAHGVLFLDEAPEFPRRVLDSLRQPLESGRITIHRAHSSATFPARTQLVLAANPCPCGNAGSAGIECTCTPDAQRRYGQRLSGPLLDRVDLQLRVERAGLAAVRMQQRGEVGSLSTATAVGLVEEARARAARRLAFAGVSRNADLPASTLRSIDLRLEQGSTRMLDDALARGQITMRGYTRVIRVAWTLADLAGVERPGSTQIAEALYFRVRDAKRG